MPHGPHLRAAIVGGGMIAGVHATALRVAGIPLRGVLASSATTTERAAARFGAPVTYADFDAVLDDDLVDVVHLCTPNRLHASQAVAALDAGKHVICEKPMATSLGEAEDVARAAERSGRQVAVPFVYRYHPVVREIRARVRAGDLGAWQVFHGSYLQDWMLDPSVSNWRVDPGQGGRSRAFADIGTHWFDAVEWVAGVRFDEVFATLTTTHAQRPSAPSQTFAAESAAAAEPGHGSASGATDALATVLTEDVACVIARTADGVPATVTISQVSAGRKNRLWFELDGAHGSAVFDQEHPESAWFGSRDGWREFLRDAATGSPEQRRLSVLPAGHTQGHVELFRAFVADAYGTFAGDTSVEGLPDVHDGVRSTAIVDAVLRSAAAGSAVEVAR
ncbi:Gfo/Idh/MocA family protein [Agromyces aerolatus]|uniref:Gfo/Idh/MocA family protein n=1 Tax=Agromyces sp. LY-1074 TaxID=3074080 RepID=UPI002864FF37|nr:MULTISPECIES: Gfo/Idh/MocA family oxidoreductase [unclassified Agromyces]MDR5701490.1 Gfo/Idh/MocA family oxidoreductase [Agromyces sp. LY-1074]MDR5704443.1 Gfo/Idh/MocA family oxidoreductase [Agromyces sp. LY-1358]